MGSENEREDGMEVGEKDAHKQTETDKEEEEEEKLLLL